MQSETVDEGGQHAHVVGGDTVHSLGGCCDTAKDITTTNDDGRFHAELVDLMDLLCHHLEDLGVDPKGLLSH